MGKRFTDTEKWRDDWWGSLPNDYRMIWLYLVDSCSIAGIWKKDFRGLNFNCNTKITEQEFVKVFGTRVIDKNNYYFIPKFLRFQCPKGLKSNKPAILSIIKELEQNNLIQTVIESLGNDFLIIKGTGKDKGREREQEKTKERESEKFSDQWFLDIFDERYLEDVSTTFKTINMENEFKIFQLKVRGSPKDYEHRDSGGIRQAFIYQLKKPSSNGQSKQNNSGSVRRTDAIIEPKKDYGTGF